MSCVEFEPTIRVFERAKMIHALDRAATVIGSLILYHDMIYYSLRYTKQGGSELKYHTYIPRLF
jgi:hypothetical protein